MWPEKAKAWSAARTFGRFRERIAGGFQKNGSFLLLAGAIALALKQHYSQAGSGDLMWILRPTAWLVEHLSGIGFEWEPRLGFVSYSRRIVIAPACAGVNFLIIAFCMAAVAGLRRFADQRVKLLWLLGSLLAAYALTALVNAVRILAATASYEADLQLGWLTAERMHRLQGVVIYFFFLCLFYRIIAAIFPLAKRIDTHSGSRASQRPAWMLSSLVPFCWYLLVTIAAPLLNEAAARDPGRFFEHSWMVAAGCCAVIFMLVLAQRVFKGLRETG